MRPAVCASGVRGWFTVAVARDSSATKRRLLDAAFAEFAEYGLAGARVDRIASAASANKQLIYAYFESKEGLFEAVIMEQLAAIDEAVPFDATDLAGYAGRVFDYLERDQAISRLTTWRRLERPDFFPLEREIYERNAQALAAETGIEQASAVDLLVFVGAAVSAWDFVPRRAFERTSPDAERDRRAGRRLALEQLISTGVAHLSP